MVGGASDMLVAVTLQEVLELFTHELWSVVRHELFREAMVCEDCPETLDGFRCGGALHGPFSQLGHVRVARNLWLAKRSARNHFPGLMTLGTNCLKGFVDHRSLFWISCRRKSFFFVLKEVLCELGKPLSIVQVCSYWSYTTVFSFLWAATAHSTLVLWTGRLSQDECELRSRRLHQPVEKGRRSQFFRFPTDERRLQAWIRGACPRREKN